VSKVPASLGNNRQRRRQYHVVVDATQTFVSKVERGERRIDVIKFADFCRAIGTDPAALLRKVLAPRRTSRSR